MTEPHRIWLVNRKGEQEERSYHDPVPSVVENVRQALKVEGYDLEWLMWNDERQRWEGLARPYGDTCREGEPDAES